MEKLQSFEDYLKDIHAKNYMGTDDNMIDSFEKWVTELQVDDLIKYADRYGAELYLAGFQSIIK